MLTLHEPLPSPPPRLNPPDPLRVVHLLRKCDPAEWGGTESAVQRLLNGLQDQRVSSRVYCPQLASPPTSEPLAGSGATVSRFRALLPVLGLSKEQRQQMVAVGGNLLSFELFKNLLSEPGLDLIHTHTMGRLGGIALTAARKRRIPLVLTIHGGLFDLPESVKQQFQTAASQGWDWGKAFGLIFGSRQVVSAADAILTCNPREASLIQAQLPQKRVVVQPHGVPIELYQHNRRENAFEAFPYLGGHEILLCVGRVDPIKNQSWLLAEAPAFLARHPRAVLVFAGPSTDVTYSNALKAQIQALGLIDRVFWVGGFSPSDPRLIGLYQLAHALVVPSISETFGLVILEAWAARTPVIASRTSGAIALINPNNGWLFDLDSPVTFHQCLDQALGDPAQAARRAAAGEQQVSAEYGTGKIAGKVRKLYEQLVEEKRALRHSAGR